MNRKKKKSKLVAFIFGLAFVGLGYAYLTANLKITGTARIGSSRFDVHFANPQMTDSSDTVTFESNSNSNITPGTPIVSGDDNTELEWNVIFNSPGDHYEFTVDVVNGGDIDAVEDLGERTLKVKIDDGDEAEIDLDDFVNDSNWPSYLTYHVDYLDDTSANPAYAYYVAADETVKLHVEVGLNENVDAEQWEAIRGKTIKLTSGFEYIQGSGLPSNSNNG